MANARPPPVHRRLRPDGACSHRLVALSDSCLLLLKVYAALRARPYRSEENGRTIDVTMTLSRNGYSLLHLPQKCAALPPTMSIEA